METLYKIIDFDKFCPSCEYYKYPEEADPCYKCLEEGARPYSSTPACYKKKEEPELVKKYIYEKGNRVKVEEEKE